MLFWNASEHFWTKLFRLLLQSLNNVCARRLLQILWERAAQLSIDCGTFDLGLLFNLSIPRSFEILTFDAGSLFVSTTISWHDRIFFFFLFGMGFELDVRFSSLLACATFILIFVLYILTTLCHTFLTVELGLELLLYIQTYTSGSVFFVRLWECLSDSSVQVLSREGMCTASVYRIYNKSGS